MRWVVGLLIGYWAHSGFAQSAHTFYMGRVEPRSTVKQIAPFAGRVVREQVMVGSLVKKGQGVLVLSRISLGNEYGEYVVKANIDGLVDRFELRPGAEFSTGAPLFSIADVERFLVKLMISDKDYRFVRLGQKLKVDSVRKKSAKDGMVGIVTRRAVTPLARSGLFPVEIELRPAPELRIGAFVRVEIPAPSVKPSGPGGRRGEKDRSR